MPSVADSSAKNLRVAFRVIIALLTIIAVETILLIWLWKPTSTETGFVFQVGGRNIIREAHPETDFTQLYPGLAPSDIDQLQRECFGIRYVYAPFIQFEPQPINGKFVEITRAGYRKGKTVQPWPLDPKNLNVFVFGGSTTLGYGLPNEQTPVACLQDSLRAAFPGKSIECYNFGRGYYFSTQEKLLFESLLSAGHVPNLAIFIDGLNDFYFYDGKPELTPRFEKYLAPDLPVKSAPRIESEYEQLTAVSAVLQRYGYNIKAAQSIASSHEVEVLFVGQPVPFYSFTRSAQTYPFQRVYGGYELCQRWYGRFDTSANKFGDRFLWCGDAFAEASAFMYADSVHYSAEGSRLLADAITAGIKTKELIH